MNPARFLNATDRFGSLERGKIADLDWLLADVERMVGRTPLK